MLAATGNAVLGLAALVILGAGLPAFAAGPAWVTVTGAVTESNREAIDPDLDKLFTFNDVTFENAREFDREALARLPQRTIITDFPKGGRTVEFTGPALADVLDAAGAQGETVILQAMDGYAIEAPRQELVDKGAVLAIARDGEPMGIGGLGPAQLVFPRADRTDLADMTDDWWIWQIFHIWVG